MKSIAEAVDEIIVVDTGSIDRTGEILSGLQKEIPNLKLFFFEWVNDFSAARNYSLSKVSQKWAFIVDDDDVLPESEKEKIRAYTDEMDEQNVRAIVDVIYDQTLQGKIISSLPFGNVRLFPSDLRYKGIIHEEVIVPEGVQRIRSDIHLVHDGWDNTVVDMSAKKRRNLTLLNQSLKSDSKNARLWMLLGREFGSIGRKEEARKYLDIAESLTDDPSLLDWIAKSR